MTKCQLCQQGDPSVDVRCWSCHKTFHLHQKQIGHLLDGTIIMGNCPSCQVGNCWLKKDKGVIYSLPVVYEGQPIVDLRGKR